MQYLKAAALLAALSQVAFAADIPICRENFQKCSVADATGLKGAVTQAAAGTGGNFIFPPSPTTLTYGSGECEVGFIPNNCGVQSSVAAADVADNIQAIIDNCIAPEAATSPSGKGSGGEAGFVPGQGCPEGNALLNPAMSPVILRDKLVRTSAKIQEGAG
ncbi:uncharacterized protein KY384_007988 [Bacidia gigantensis]|uniref:uncharacterized protein n=1 Tax=Bacidia gigantensis TaxID=2732470 RepID=UPI001D04F3CE|nr:uncharacterized protein KY384_007988 [Bacidia gigantensis]KAG8527244.1 hypothetical protein KY384_007988 [Bacidia gigantensis]